MTTAFQRNAFQDNAFQIDAVVVTTPAVIPGGAGSVSGKGGHRRHGSFGKAWQRDYEEAERKAGRWVDDPVEVPEEVSQPLEVVAAPAEAIPEPVAVDVGALGKPIADILAAGEEQRRAAQIAQLQSQANAAAEAAAQKLLTDNNAAAFLLLLD